ncbi:MAG: hypothetical protein M3Q75_02395 [Gemmatimonadota bacterium]|nr:hypothetical protein [Gemmatimonadota bacterium]
MDPIVVAFGTALVGAMATEVWQQARGAVVALWRRVCLQQADIVARIWRGCVVRSSTPATLAGRRWSGL